MSDLIRTRLLAMIDAELKETVGSISYNKLWHLGSKTEEEAKIFEGNLFELEELKEILLKFREQVVEDELKI